MSDDNDDWTQSFAIFDHTRSELRHALGDQAGDQLYRAAELVNLDPDAPAAWAAAVRAARLTLLHIGASNKIAPGNLVRAISTTTGALERAEKMLRDAKPPAKSGRPVASPDILLFQGRAVLAVSWLQRLKAAPMLRTKALTAVAREIPAPMLSKRGNILLTQAEQLAAWRDAFGRTDDKDRQRVLKRLRWEIFDAWVPEIEPLKDDDGNPLVSYDDEARTVTITYPGDDPYPYRDETDATPADVLAWLKSGLPKK